MPPREPPFNGDEAAAVFGALHRQRTTFRWKCADLDAAGLRATTAASKLTLGGLLKHLAVQEDYSFQVKILGAPMPEPWDLSVWETQGDDWEFDSAAVDAPDKLYSLWDTAVSRSRSAFAEIADRGGLDSAAAITLPDGGPVNVRRIVMDLLEEYARHTGHADILREAIDGRVGEDPPWPVAD
jgi:Protein of unknown function (DUF664)